MWRFLKRAFTRDIPLKLASFGLAIFIMLLILVVRMEPRKFQGIRVDVTDKPENMFLRSGPDPKRIDLTVRGPRELLDELAGKLSVEISLSGLGAGRHNLHLSPANVKIDLPAIHRKRVQVDSDIAEWEVKCELEMFTRELPVATPEIEGEPEPPYYCDPTMLEIQPRKIMVTAAPEILDQLEKEQRALPLQNDVVNVGGFNQEVLHRRYRVEFEALRVEPVYSSDDEVVVTIRLERTDYEKELPVENVQVRNLPEGSQSSFATEEKIRALVEGRRSLVEALQPAQLTAWLDASLVGAATDYVGIPYEVTAPAGMRVRVKAWKPETIRLKVTAEKEAKGKAKERTIGG